MAVVFLAGTATATLAKESGGPSQPFERAPRPNELQNDRPAGADNYLRFDPDTLLFGDIAGDGWAVAGDIWDFTPGVQGWYSVDVTEQPTAFFRQITSSIWTTGTGNLVAAPLLNGAGSLWVGAFENQADALCWDAGLGYGNAWCQRALSPTLGYTGSGNISLSLEYFNDSEPNFDYSKVILRRLPSGEEVSLNFDGFTDQIGLATNHPASIPVGAVYADVIGAGDLQGETSFQLVFEFTSDGGWSDEDGSYATEYGPFAADDVALSGSLTGGNVTYTFNSGLEGWTPQACPGFGSFMGVRDVSLYNIEDPCDCDLAGNVLEFHNDDFVHPYGQHVYGVSNPVNALRDVPAPSGGNNVGILANWDQYSVMPRANGVFYRPGWDYFPFTCPETGAVQWSGRKGQDNFFYVGNDPLCVGNRNVGTTNGVPGVGVEQIRFIFETYASCDAFGIPPDVCTDITNFTPIIDNVQIGFTEVPAAPAIAFASGTRYQDTFATSDLLDPNGVGRADIVSNVNFGNTAPFIGGDSLYVSGPTSTSSTRWESRLWFRINREGPGTKPSRYNAWKTAIADGKNITGGEFTFAWMDSFQLGTQTAKNKFVSFLRDTGEDDYNWDGGGELAGNNEIIRDDVLVAGTGIDYFVTSNYTVSPTQNFTLPDTSGQFFNEFSVLPNWINDAGTFKFPCILYVDAFNGGSEFFITNAMNVLGLEYDKYDYLDASSNWKNPMARGATNAEQNGVTLPQLLGYKAILINTGTLAGQCMWPEDFVLFGDYLTAIICNSNVNRQGFILNGDNTATILEGSGPAFLTTLGAVQVEDAYNGFGGTPDENFCVQLESPTIPGKYGTSNSTNNYDYDAFGNWCPNQFSFDVIGTAGTGTGNRAFVNVGNAARTNYAQVANQVDAAASGNFRSVVDGISYHHLSERDAVDECVGDSAHIVTATFNEIAAGLEWMFGVGSIPSLCVNPCTTVDAPDVTGLDAGSTRLYQNSPNPFNPRTVLRFSLAQTGQAELSIYDVNGRLVKTLVSGQTEAGLHEVVWDGTDEAGNAVASGVFWSQLSTDGFKSNKKMVVLR
jgi:hypothetical protein